MNILRGIAKWLRHGSHKSACVGSTPTPATPPTLRWDYTIQIVFDTLSGTHRAIVLSTRDNTKKHLEKTNLEWLMMDLKLAVLEKEKQLAKSDEPELSRIITPAQFSANGA